jgi:hypothetical protein
MQKTPTIEQIQVALTRLGWAIDRDPNSHETKQAQAWAVEGLVWRKGAYMVLVPSGIDLHERYEDIIRVVARFHGCKSSNVDTIFRGELEGGHCRTFEHDSIAVRPEGKRCGGLMLDTVARLKLIAALVEGRADVDFGDYQLQIAYVLESSEQLSEIN